MSWSRLASNSLERGSSAALEKFDVALIADYTHSRWELDTSLVLALAFRSRKDGRCREKQCLIHLMRFCTLIVYKVRRTFLRTVMPVSRPHYTPLELYHQTMLIELYHQTMLKHDHNICLNMITI